MSVILKRVSGKYDGDMNWLYLAQDTDHWRSFVNKVMKYSKQLLWTVHTIFRSKSTDVSEEHVSIFRVEYTEQNINVKAGGKLYCIGRRKEVEERSTVSIGSPWERGITRLSSHHRVNQ
jgi:hypothetical protein